mmetsp:Transcript_20235/g.42396  ORF Transcript_20235/g.42396 Transcript_20235/m.42396 type:complete len:117 (-) Transcript_20235:313-663(-)
MILKRKRIPIYILRISQNNETKCSSISRCQCRLVDCWLWRVCGRRHESRDSPPLLCGTITAKVNRNSGQKNMCCQLESASNLQDTSTDAVLVQGKSSTTPVLRSMVFDERSQKDGL